MRQLIKDKIFGFLCWIEMEKYSYLAKYHDDHPELRECAVCKKETFADYMVHDSIWREHFPSEGCLVHLHCLEKTIGRRLTIDDFTPAPVNDTLRWALTRN